MPHDRHPVRCDAFSTPSLTWEPDCGHRLRVVLLPQHTANHRDMKSQTGITKTGYTSR
jgi:hypothetical protein